MRRGKWNRLNHAIDLFKAQGDDPDTGAYALCLGDLEALETEMERVGQLRWDGARTTRRHPRPALGSWII